MIALSNVDGREDNLQAVQKVRQPDTRLAGDRGAQRLNIRFTRCISETNGSPVCLAASHAAAAPEERRVSARRGWAGETDSLVESPAAVSALVCDSRESDVFRGVDIVAQQPARAQRQLRIIRRSDLNEKGWGDEAGAVRLQIRRREINEERTDRGGLFRNRPDRQKPLNPKWRRDRPVDPVT
jgi:hypothetical protein